jgi:hypothetical protein
MKSWPISSGNRPLRSARRRLKTPRNGARDQKAKTAAQAVTEGHNAALAGEHKKATTYQERAELLSGNCRGSKRRLQVCSTGRGPDATNVQILSRAYRDLPFTTDASKANWCQALNAHNPSPRLYDSTKVAIDERAANVNKTTRAAVRNGVMTGLLSPVLQYNQRVAGPDISDCDLGHSESTQG